MLTRSGAKPLYFLPSARGTFTARQLSWDGGLHTYFTLCWAAGLYEAAHLGSTRVTQGKGRSQSGHCDRERKGQGIRESLVGGTAHVHGN